MTHQDLYIDWIRRRMRRVPNDTALHDLLWILAHGRPMPYRLALALRWGWPVGRAFQFVDALADRLVAFGGGEA